MTVTPDQLTQLQRFHSCIFAEVLRLEKPNLEFDPQKAEANYLIAPLNKCEKRKGKKIHLAQGMNLIQLLIKCEYHDTVYDNSQMLINKFTLIKV